MSEAEIKLWYRHFKYGRKSIESDLRSAMLSRTRTLENVERVRIVIKENLTIDRARIRKKHGAYCLFSHFEYLTCHFFVPCAGALFGKSLHYSVPFQHSCSLPFSAFLKAKITDEREKTSDRQRDAGWSNKPADSDT